jgi:glycosyltransferase involved in cell wall biosynthesis
MAADAVSLIVPACDESGSIEGTVREAVAAFARHGIERQEIVLVDDGSRDDTRAVMDRLGRELPTVRVVTHDVNRGLGAAIRTGLSAAHGDILLWVPGDGQYAVNDLLHGLSLLDSGGVVIGLRRARGDVARGLVSRCFHGLIFLFFRFDASRMSGLFMIRRAVFERLRPQSGDVFLNYEIPLLCVRHGLRVEPLDVTLHPRRSGVSKVVNARTIGRILWEMARFRLRLWHGSDR